MQVFKTKSFAKFAYKERIPDSKFCEAVTELENGEADADYGGGLYKQRISRLGQGKSGSYRSLICFRQGNKAFFAYGFAKKDKASLSSTEVKVYKELAKFYLGASGKQIAALLDAGDITKVECNG